MAHVVLLGARPRDDILRIVDGEVRLAVDREEIVTREHETRTP